MTDTLPEGESTTIEKTDNDLEREARKRDILITKAGKKPVIRQRVAPDIKKKPKKSKNKPPDLLV